MPIEVRRVTDKKMLKEFIKTPFKLYKDDPYWVPPLISERMAFMDRKKNPFFLYNEAEYFIAYKDGEAAGTIAGIINNNHNEAHDENIGFFGIFDVVDDYEVAAALFGAAADYVKDAGKDAIRGPANFSSNDEWGMLIEGFDSSPVVMMLYNPPFYNDFVSRYGFDKAMDLLAWYIDVKAFNKSTEKIPDKFKRAVRIAEKRSRISVRTLDFKNIEEEADKIRDVYNDAWELNWGFVPMKPEEFDHLAKGLKEMADRRMVFVAETEDGKPVGFALNLPDVHWLLKKIKGHLLPFGWLKWLIYKNRIPFVRTLTLGVIPEYRGKGIEAALIYYTMVNGIMCGYKDCEMSWILETNTMMNRILERMDAEIYKKYRIYEKSL
ncbi:MAG: N-acetyltransferase [bacterium]|nr:N-acetyltransferase [bacterium]